MCSFKRRCKVLDLKAKAQDEPEITQRKTNESLFTTTAWRRAYIRPDSGHFTLTLIATAA